jgi:hypothetical protein
MNSWWTPVQACVWIATRDERLVRAARVKDTLASAEEIIAEQTLLANDAAASESEVTNHPVADACIALQEACVSQAIGMFGRERGSDPLVAIPSEAWSNLEIRDQERLGVVAAPVGNFDDESKWWDVLRLWDNDVLRHWALPRKRRSANIYSWDSRPDTLGEALWAARRWRKVEGRPAMSLELSEDGLPKTVETTLVEALSWCAVGKAIPVLGWKAEEGVKSADEAYANARNRYADSLHAYRLANSNMKAAGNPKYRGDPIFIAYSVAAEMALENQKAEKDALVEFAKQVEWRQLIIDVFNDVKSARGISPDDKTFAQRLVDEAEQDLFRSFQRGELECLGRKDSNVPEWEPLPKDYFRLPLGVRMNHNILEPSDRATVEEHKLIMSHVSKWIDLRVDVQQLRVWRSGGGAVEKTVEPVIAQGVTPAAAPQFEYVNAERLEALRTLPTEKYDLRKLVRLCEELNSNFTGQNYLSTAMLVRAILDHVPPIFGCVTFSEVAANYGGGRSFKDAMESLNRFSRKIADRILHGAARRQESLPNATQVNFSHALDLLLGEIERSIKENS